MNSDVLDEYAALDQISKVSKRKRDEMDRVTWRGREWKWSAQGTVADTNSNPKISTTNNLDKERYNDRLSLIMRHIGAETTLYDAATNKTA